MEIFGISHTRWERDTYFNPRPWRSRRTNLLQIFQQTPTSFPTYHALFFLFFHMIKIGDNKEVLRIPQNSSITGNSPLDSRHAGHCWRSRDELISDVLLWTPTHGRAKAGRPARTYIQQLWEDTGCCPEDLPRAMNDREEWRERVRDIRATSVTRWWWWWWVSYSGHLLGVSYPSAEKQSLYSTAPADWASVPRSNGNDELLDSPQSSRTKTLSLDAF